MIDWSRVRRHITLAIDEECSAPPVVAPVGIATLLPSPIKEWWMWTEKGFEAWNHDIWAIIGWLLAAAALLVVLPIAGIGQLSRWIRGVAKA